MGCEPTAWRFDQIGYLRAVLTARVYDVAVSHSFFPLIDHKFIECCIAPTRLQHACTNVQSHQSMILFSRYIDLLLANFYFYDVHINVYFT